MFFPANDLQLQLTQPKQTRTIKLKDTITQNKHLKTKARFGCPVIYDVKPGNVSGVFLQPQGHTALGRHRTRTSTLLAKMNCLHTELYKTCLRTQRNAWKYIRDNYLVIITIHNVLFAAKHSSQQPAIHLLLKYMSY